MKKETTMAKLKENANVTLSAIQKKMLPAITLPMAEDCPTGLRYALANFDSGSVRDAWDALRDLEAAGLLED
jgi:hypothetical protein